MAYPLQLYDFSRSEDKKFLIKLDLNMTRLFGKIDPSDKIKCFSKFNSDNIPRFLIDAGEKALSKIMENNPIAEHIPEINKKWKATIGMYGRKNGSVIKKEKDILYRLVINIGDPEVYYLNGQTDDQYYDIEPIVLFNGYAILLSPSGAENLDIKVFNDPIRNDKRILNQLPRIRNRKYMRCTIVLDLLVPQE